MSDEAPATAATEKAAYESDEWPDKLSPLWLASRFHEHYEALAPAHGYETRPESRVEWKDVPDANRTLMVEVAGRVLDEILDYLVETADEIQGAVLDPGTKARHRQIMIHTTEQVQTWLGQA